MTNYYNNMAHLNRSGEKAQRVCTTPERMRLVESIKKSIHRSIQKINPNEYKNILKGEYIFMHLCHGGQIINSEYTKVALFMGAAVFKKAMQKVTVVVTNESSNKTVKKLAAMGKPILSVLWLEACFQQKRKVEYEDFLFQQLPNAKQNQDQRQQDIPLNFQILLQLHKKQVDSFEQEFMCTHNYSFLKFIEKKQKIDIKKYETIPIHDIQIKLNYPNQAKQRKSQIITHKQPKKKNVTKKVQFKSEGANKSVSYNVVKLVESENNKDEQYQNQNVHIDNNKEEIVNAKERTKLSKSIYEKYLKDYNNFEQKMQNKVKIQQIPLKIEEKETPCFINISHKNQRDFMCEQNLQTPIKAGQNQQNNQLYRTYSIKKSKNNNFKVSIVHPIISQQVQKINESRLSHNLVLIQIVGSDMRNTTWVISHQSKIQAILALLSEPKIIVNQGFIKFLQDNPCSEITNDLLQKYKVNFRLNTKSIEGKNIILLDSVMGSSSLQKIIKKCKASVVNSRDYLLGTVKVDITITNKKYFMKNPNDIVMSQANFIDSLIFMQNK